MRLKVEASPQVRHLFGEAKSARVVVESASGWNRIEWDVAKRARRRGASVSGTAGGVSGGGGGGRGCCERQQRNRPRSGLLEGMPQRTAIMPPRSLWCQTVSKS